MRKVKKHDNIFKHDNSFRDRDLGIIVFTKHEDGVQLLYDFNVFCAPSKCSRMPDS